MKFIPGIQGWFILHKSTNGIHHVNKIKAKHHMIISIDAQKIWQNPTFIYDKNFQKTGYRETCLNITCVVNPQITLYSKKKNLKAFSL